MQTSQNYISEKIRNSSNTLINPSTEEKQDTIIGHVDGIEGQLTTLNAKDFATTAKQDTGNNLVDALYELVARLDFLPSIRGVLADIRVTPTGTVTTTGTVSTVTTVTTVSTLTNQSQQGGYFTNTNVSNVNNTLVEVSNIRNIVIS